MRSKELKKHLVGLARLNKPKRQISNLETMVAFGLLWLALAGLISEWLKGAV